MTIDTQKLLSLFDTAAQAHGWGFFNDAGLDVPVSLLRQAAASAAKERI